MSYIDDMIEAAVAPLRLMFELVTDGSVDDDGAFSGDGLDGEGIDGQIGWHFGFYSRPRDGFTGVVAKLGGGASSLLFAFRDKQYEIALEKGEVAMVSAFNSRFHLKANGDADLVAPGNVHLGTDTGLTPAVNGVVLASAIDTFSGATLGTLGGASSTVMAKKV